MNIEIVAIGTEVLTGYTVNTNAAFMSQELLKAGFSVQRHTAVPDEEKALKQVLTEALERSTVVIATGGLGPTCDDISRKVAADLFGCGFALREELVNDLRTRFGEHLASIIDQATLPELAEALLNPLGTAPGLVFRKNQKMLILLPGVPSEMQLIFQGQVLPLIEHQFQGQAKKHVSIISLFGLPESSVDPLLRELQAQYPYVEYGIYTSMGSLSIQLAVVANDALAADVLLHDPAAAIKEIFRNHVFESPNSKLEEAIHNLFIARNMTLSLAESCTGGQAAARLTALPGCSAYFKGSMVAYSNDWKAHFLNVPREILERYGAVSAETAGAMAIGMLNSSQTDWSAAITGVAGPDGGSPEKPVGTVWGAVCSKGRDPLVWKIPTRGNRTTIITRSVNALFAKLLVEAGK